VNQKEINETLEMYLDSGAFETMIRDRGILQEYSECDKLSIECAGNQILRAEGKGNICVSKEENGLESINSAYFVPGLSENLLSVSSVGRSGFISLFDEETCGIYRREDVKVTGKPLLSGFEKDGTYKVTLKLREFNALKMGKESTYNLWHKRLGHLGKSNVELMSNGLVLGIDNVSAPEGLCTICVRAKHTRGAFPGGNAHRASELLELVHSDLCSMECTSLGGYKHFVTFIDDKSRYTFVGLLKSKESEEVLKLFKEYKTLVETQTGLKLKALRSDNGGEYMSKTFRDFLKSEGIVHQTTIPHTPEQNGVAERANRTLEEKTRAMLKGAKLGTEYWGEALLTATYLKNISPTKAVKGKVPFEAWTKEKPDISNLRIFGCQAYKHVPKTDCKKLGDRGKPCIFVGYCEHQKGYRLINPEEPQKILNATSVVFDETMFPGILKTGQVRHTQSEGLPPMLINRAEQGGDCENNSESSQEASESEESSENDSEVSVEKTSEEKSSSESESTDEQDGEDKFEENSSVSETYSTTDISRRSSDEVSTAESSEVAVRSEGRVKKKNPKYYNNSFVNAFWAASGKLSEEPRSLAEIMEKRIESTGKTRCERN